MTILSGGGRGQVYVPLRNSVVASTVPVYGWEVSPSTFLAGGLDSIVMNVEVADYTIRHTDFLY
jgi:hypothetical protein